MNLRVWEETRPHAIPGFPGVPTGTSAARACCWQSFGHLRLEATLRLITCLCSCADTPDHLQSLASRRHAPEKAPGSRFEICPHTGALRVGLAKEAAARRSAFLGEYVSNSLLALVVFRGARSEWDLFKVSSDPC